MGASTIRSKFDELERVAAVFGGQADGTRQMLQKLQRQIDELQGGGWVGRGAKAFYAEMEHKVTPAVKSLSGALDGAAQNTQKASQVMQQAELDVTRLFSAKAAGGVIAPGPAGAPGAAALGAAGAQATAQAAAQAAGVAGAAAAAGQAIGSAVKAATRAAEDKLIDKTLSKFSQKVRDLAKKSPTLRAELLSLANKGFKINTGPAGKGSFTNSAKKLIVIGQPDNDANTLSGLAHEVGHGISKLPSKIPATASMTKAQYVKANVDNEMQNEGEAQFNAAQVRAELKKAGGPDIGIPGGQTAKYQKVYDNYAAGKITKPQAVSQMGTLMGKETTSTPPSKPYRQYYGDWYRSNWDRKIAPGRRSK